MSGGRVVRSAKADEADGRAFVIDESLGYLVNRLARLMAARLGERLRPHGVAIGQWAVLMHLWAEDGLSQAELSRRVAVEPPTLVRTLDRMVRDGLVTRSADARDARVTRIHLTPRGSGLAPSLVPEAVATNRAALAGLSDEEAAALRASLRKVIDALAEAGVAE